MNPVFNEKVIKVEIFHKDFNLNKNDNLDELADLPAVFGIFGIIHETPIHPRFIASTSNLRKIIRELFEEPEVEGLRVFMQGPWVKMLCYELLNDTSEDERKKKENAWIEEYAPGINEDGEYPDYCYEWPYDNDGNLLSAYRNNRVINM